MTYSQEELEEIVKCDRCDIEQVWELMTDGLCEICWSDMNVSWNEVLKK